ncbi:MAG: tetraacyldisaccharide 4'-kinase [Alphaproteobacteria bacterium]|jgi:tetraacyldisaccharide 4'-kinase
MLIKLQHAWYTDKKWVWCLFPFTVLFCLLSSARRFFFRVGVLPSKGAAIPVVVVGNIGIGGNGKTPLVLALLKALRLRGYTPAVLSRGYGGNQSNFPYLVSDEDTAKLVGDEPALITKREQCILVIDPIRARGVDFIEQNTGADVVICDDGLQHYAMKRDIEICVLDKRGLGNEYLLPMGPLREGKWRLQKVDATVHNIGFTEHNESNNPESDSDLNSFKMALQPACWVNVHTQEEKSLGDFTSDIVSQNGKVSITALAGIGDPKRFFDTLDSMKIKLDKAIGFPDHHQFIEDDIPKTGWVLMTEKDAVKCLGISHINTWYLRIDAVLCNKFYTLIEDGIETKAKLLAKSRA